MAKVLIVGAGAAGLMAAGAAVRQGHQVTVLEHTDKPGQKILVTGKGRCNVTNDCTAEEFLHHVRTNPRFLFSSLGAFPPARTMELFESLGVELKVERGRRVFPVSDKAEEIRQALLRYAQDAEIVYDGAKKLLLEELPPEPEAAPAVPENPRHPKKKKAGPALRCVGVRGTSGKEYRADAVLVATGGVSYPTTGSTGDGYAMAREIGHKVTAIRPALIPLVCSEAWPKELQGISLKNVTFSVDGGGRRKAEEFGEMLFTHFGVSGPIVLSLSDKVSLWLSQGHGVKGAIDLKPALSLEVLDKRLLRDFEKYHLKQMASALVDLMPHRMIDVVLRLSSIPRDLPVSDLKKGDRLKLAGILKHLPLTITGTRPLSEAIVTAGGVSVKEINPSTMESKICKHVYMAGEVLDIHAFTGGYNLQAAFSTGHLAALSAVKELS